MILMPFFNDGPKRCARRQGFICTKNGVNRTRLSLVLDTLSFQVLGHFWGTGILFPDGDGHGDHVGMGMAT